MKICIRSYKFPASQPSKHSNLPFLLYLLTVFTASQPSRHSNPPLLLISPQSSFGKINKGTCGSNSSYNSTGVVGLGQSPNHRSSMLAELKGHHICPHCKRECATLQGLGSHLRIHKRTNPQQNPIMKETAVLALPVPTTVPKTIKNQEAMDHTTIAQGEAIQERGKPKMMAMEDQNSVFPLMFVPSASKGGLDWSQEGPSSGPSNLNLEQLDPETVCPQTHKREEHYPRLVDFMNILKHEEEINGSFANEITNSELMELRQAELGQGVPAVNTNLTLHPEGIDLTLRL